MRLFLFKLIMLLCLVSKAQGDCPGTCTTSNGTFTAVTGTVLELNTTNRGCLTAGEANSSYWFEFCFSTSGIFQFYIDPNGNRNDFDFAIWNAVSCPPTTAPIRCSYAGVPPGGPCATCDYTGLGNGAIDVSEGATGNGYVAPLSVTAGQCILLNINNFGAGSSTFTLNLTGTTAIITCPILAIELISFGVEFKTDHNYLTWITVTETNNDYFTIERSIDALNWVDIAEIPGEEFSSTPKMYEYKDYRYEEDKINYYRLKQTDLNGEYEYFSIVEIHNKTSKPSLLKITDVFGNPILDSYIGIQVHLYSDGSYKKIIKLN